MMKSAKSRSTSAARTVVRSLMQRLHEDLAARILEPTDHRLAQAVEDDVLEVWVTCQIGGLTPWRYCLDRYCDCKIVLLEGRPESLPGLEECSETTWL